MVWKRLAAVVATLSFANVLAADEPDTVAKSDPRTPAEERKTFHLPPGFEIELVAAEPEIHKPMNMAFDDRGRLWVTETVEYPFAVEPGKVGRDGVKILSDFGPDGHAREVETFANGLNIPIGILPLPTDEFGRSSALVYSIPNIFRIDQQGQRRVPLYASYGFRDTHGMTNAFTWGFDGWVYATHGFSNDSNVEGSDKKSITMNSGNTYRMKPDGSHLEYYCHGQVNPFGLAFDPLGYLYSSDCHSRPVYQLIRGAYYPSFGKPDDGLGFGPEMATHDHGSTGIAGIVYYAADHFPEAYRDTIYIGNVVTNRINHDRIEWHGSSPKAIEQPDFLVSDDPWFRPVDLKLGPDGALYIADFYNRIIGHYEVPLTHPGRDRERGRIWRVVYRGKDRKERPLFPRIIAENETNLRVLKMNMASSNITVRTLASNQYSAVERLALDSLKDVTDSPVNAAQKVHALWTLYRQQVWNEARAADWERGTNTPFPRPSYLNTKLITSAAKDSDRTIRVHTMRILAERPEDAKAYAETVREALKDEDPHVRRAAAEALGRHPDTSHIRKLLALRASTPADDTHLVHVTRIALRDQLTGDSAWTFLEKQGLTDREAADVADVAPGVPTAASARFLFAHLKSHPEKHENLVRYVHHVARHLDPKAEPELLAFLRDSAAAKSGGLAARVALLKAFHQGMQERGGQLSEDDRKFALSLTTALLDSPHGNEVDEGIAQAMAFRLEGVRDRLGAIAGNVKAPEAQRAEALSALAAVDPKASASLMGRTLADPASPMSLRERAAALLASGNQPETQAELLKVLPTAPEQLQNAIGAGLAARGPGAEALLNAIGTGKASARLLQDNQIAGLLANAKVPDLADRLAKLLKGLPPADARINALIARRREAYPGSKAEASLGAKVFETHCAACHQIGGKGAKIGPQLDGIGVRGLDRTLEDILDPSRNVDQTFRTTTLALKDGRVVSGLLLNDAGEVLVMADSQGKEVRVPKDSVEERSLSSLSPMPANFSDQIPEADFFRLVAYLLSQRPPQ